jgi:hypothetical protein
MTPKVNLPGGYKTEAGTDIPAGQYEAVSLQDGKVGLKETAGQRVFQLSNDVSKFVLAVIEGHTYVPPKVIKPEPLTEEDIRTMHALAHEHSKANAGDINLDLMINDVPGEIGERFDAHGIAKVDTAFQLRSLIAFLDNGIDTTRSFHSAALSWSDENKGAGAGFGVAGGANITGSFVILGDIDTPLKTGGIKNVIVNDAYYEAIPRLQRAYPHIRFIRANQATAELTRMVEAHDRLESSK